MTADRPVLGILLMLGFCILAPLGDSIAKLLGGTIPLLQLLFADLPNVLAALGSGITICAGLYVVFREHAVSRR